MPFRVILLLCAFLFTLLLASNPEDSVIKSGVIWTDTDGKPVHAHGGGIYLEGNKYYLVGTTQKQGPKKFLSSGINLYSSTDLASWHFEGEIFHNTSITNVGVGGPYRIERPKIIYNELTKKYVMWFHLDTAGFTLRNTGVATCDTINGAYKFVAGFKPDGLDSYDMGLYKDETGAYLVRSVENKFAGISKLSDDYLQTTGIISKGPRIEGQCIFKYNKRYYLLGSHLTGWNANQAVLSISDGDKLDGAKWTELTPITSSKTTYNSQSTYVLPYFHPDGKELFIYMGDRWDYPHVDQASYVWLPLEVHATKNITMPFEAEWQIKDY